MANILIIITGSIAAIKIPDLVSNFKKQGHNVTCVLTKSANKFVTADSLSYLSENKTHSDLFAVEDESKMAHISLSRDNDLILVAPASADFIAKMANGFCDDLASTICLAADKQIIVAPAMNTKMYEHPATQRNIKTIKSDGVQVIKPDTGKLACGEEGIGKMASLERIIDVVNVKLKAINLNLKPDLTGFSCLVTSGPTRENIDPVRYISNYSSGKQGHAIAEVLSSYGADVTLVSGPTELEVSNKINLIEVQSAQEMLEASKKQLPVDIAVCAAAVSDWAPKTKADNKMKKKPGEEDQILSLMLNPDILYEISNAGKKRPQLVIGFAAETEHLIENALVKLERKKCDWIVANNVGDDEVFNSDDNTVHFIDKNGVIEALDKCSKIRVAEELGYLIGKHLKDSENIAYLNSKKKKG